MVIIMKKTAAVTAALLSFTFCAHSFAEGTFLCMRADESTAITADTDGSLKYIDMTASNGEVVYPQISTDGNTYLPFRYVCEMAGLKDAAGIAGELPDGYFRYWGADPSVPGDTQKIEIRCGGNYYCHDVGKSFTYEVKPGDVRTVSIYNIRGSLYFPMTYMAKITHSKAVWNGNSGRIMYISNSLNSSDFIDERNDLRRDKELNLGFDYFSNNLTGSPLYLKSDGITVSSLSDEIEGNPYVRSVTRSGKTIYFVDESGRVCTKHEDSPEVSRISFSNADGAVDVSADTAIVVQNRLYGIQVNSAGEKYGRLFECRLDGSGFRYITDKTVYNLFLRKYGGNLYLYYCDAATKSDLYMTELKTMDEYKIEITDFSRNNLLSNIDRLAVGEKTVAYIDGSERLHVIDLGDNLEEYEIIRTDVNTIFAQGEDGEPLNNITSMNYDHINGVLYVTQVDYTGKTYYYTRSLGKFRRLERSPHPVTRLALFSDVNYNDICAKIVNGKPQVDYVRFSDGAVEFVN